MGVCFSDDSKKFEGQVNEHKKKLQNLQQEIAKKDESVKRLQNEQDESKRQASALEVEKSKLLDLYSEAQRELEKSKSIIESKPQPRDDQDGGKGKQLKDELTTATTRVKDLETQVEELEMRESTAKQDLERSMGANKRLKDDQKAKDETHSKLQRDMERIQEEKSSLEGALRYLEQERDQAKDEIKQLQEERDQVQREANRLKEEREYLIQESQGDAPLKAQLEEQARLLEEERGKRADERRLEDSEKAQLQNDLKKLMEENESLRTTVEETKNTAEYLKQQIEHTELEKGSVQAAYDKAYDEGQAARSEMARLESEVSEMRRQVETSAEDAVSREEAAKRMASMEADLANSERQYSIVEAQLTALSQENERVVNSAMQARRQAEAGATEASQQRNELMASNAQLRKANEALHLEVTQLVGASQDAEARLGPLQARLQQLEQASEDQRLRADKLAGELKNQEMVNESTASQTSALLDDYRELKEKYASLQFEYNVKDEMLGLLQQQIAEAANMDPDALMKGADSNLSASVSGTAETRGGGARGRSRSRIPSAAQAGASNYSQLSSSRGAGLSRALNSGVGKGAAGAVDPREVRPQLE